VILPTRRGGELLARVVAAIRAQRTGIPVEIVVVDSGSPPAELESLRAAGVRVLEIPPASFDHGATRDLGAAAASGEWLVFLNQDAVPADDLWLEHLIAPFASTAAPVAVQGAIREMPPEWLAELGGRRFFWDSCGPRFYFTRESEAWIARHGGIGFSTVHCAILRTAWTEQPFGKAAILEDKLWQRGATERGWAIVEAPEAVVFHTHDYGWRALVRRCLSEGYGWRLVGERYPVGAALRDLVQRTVWREWWRGLRAGEMRRAAEVFFPFLRPLALWWGNRWAGGVRLG